MHRFPALGLLEGSIQSESVSGVGRRAHGVWTLVPWLRVDVSRAPEGDSPRSALTRLGKYGPKPAASSAGLPRASGVLEHPGVRVPAPAHQNDDTVRKRREPEEPPRSWFLPTGFRSRGAAPEISASFLPPARSYALLLGEPPSYPSLAPGLLSRRARVFPWLAPSTRRVARRVGRSAP